jgi:hypothetical protein
MIRTSETELNLIACHKQFKQMTCLPNVNIRYRPDVKKHKELQSFVE